MTPALGIAYSLWMRARWAIVGITLYLLCLAIAARFFAGSREPILLAALLVTAAIAHLLQVFTLGPSDLGIRASGFPKHMFVLPLSARSLVGWPMLFGAATHASLWILVATLVFIPAGFAAPVAWPAALIAAGTAWVQAIGWMPFPTPYARVPALALAMTPLICFGAWCGLFLERSDVSSVVVAGSVIWGMVAYAFGVRGLARARRGDDGNMNFVIERLRRVLASSIPETRLVARRPFRSPATAQLWHEWRRNASFLPAMIALIGVPMLALNCKIALDAQANRTLMFGSVPVSTPLMSSLMSVGVLLMLAATIGASLGKFDIWGKEAMPSFFAVRPMTSAQFVRVKMMATAFSAMASVTILLVMFAIWAAIEISPLNPRESAVRSAVGELTWRKAAIAGFSVFALCAITWRGIAIGLWPSLTGRKWISIAIGVFFTGAMTLAIIAGSWIYQNPAIQSGCLTALPWLLGVLVAAKAGAAAWAIRFLLDQRLSTPRALTFGLVGWLVCALMILAVVCYFTHINWPVVAGTTLLVPFTRLMIASAALHWNRHR
ncbi:MAG TPA: hypothetical protein VHK01_13605 [Lacipirellulaceae bacterium]|nr:hypothetical protein [Lacipirellulaceae bacterium]